MRRAACRLISVLFAFPCAAALSPDEIDRAVRELGSAEFEAREAAFRRLLETGAGDPDAVLRALPSTGADPEILSRCAALRERIPIERLRRGILGAPGLDPAFGRAVESLLDAPSPEKVSGLAPWAVSHAPRVAGAARVFLGHSSEAIRLAAVSLAARTREPSLAPDLLALTGEAHSREIRIAAITALAGLDHPDAREGVLAALADRDPAVRLSAVAASRLVDSPEAAGRLLARLPAEELVEVKEAVIRALGPRGGDAAAREAVLSLLSDGNPAFRGAALDAIHPGSGGSRVILLHAAADGNAFADEAVRDILLARLPAEGSAGLRARLVQSLDAWERTPRTRQAVLALLDDPDGSVRAQVARYLSHRGTERAELERLLARFDRETLSHVRAAIVAAAGAAEEPEVAVPFLARSLSDPDEGVALTAIHALPLCGGKAAAGVLAGFIEPRGALSDARETRLEEALQVLGQVRERAAIPALARLISATSPPAGDHIRYVAALALLASAGFPGDAVEDHEIVDAAADWWKAHKDDPEFKEAR